MSKPIWDTSDDSNVRYVATEDLGPYVPKGSVFEINKQTYTDIQPIYCTVHLLGSELKLFVSKKHVEVLQDKLELIEAKS